MEKALIKSTGEILEIKSQRFFITIKGRLNNSLMEKFNLETECNISSKNENQNCYILSNGKSYSEEEIIVGDRKIRNYKLNKLL